MNPITGIGKVVITGLTAVARFFNLVNTATSYYKDTSLSEVSKLLRVEPYTLVSKDLLNNPEIKDILNSMLSIFTGHYLQSIDILTKINDIEVVRILDRLNPDRDETGFLLSHNLNEGKKAGNTFNLINTESYGFRLPTKSHPALEAIYDHTEYTKDKVVGDNKTKSNYDLKDLHKEDELRAKAREFKEFGEGQNIKEVDLDALVNLSIGRLVNVKIAYSKKNPEGRDENLFTTFPISFRLLVSSTATESLVRIMTYKSQDISFIERLHSARSGRIEFIRDLIFCQDLIDEQRRATNKDPSHILSEITRRATNAKKYGLLSNNPSLAVASTLIVISDNVAREVELKLGGKLSNPRIREKAFENTYTMVIAVVSNEWETVTYYIRGIAAGATFGFKELQGKSKGNGPDIADIFKAIVAGQPPSF